MGERPYFFHSSCTTLLCHQQHPRVPVSPNPSQHFLFSSFLIVTVLSGGKWYLILVLICTSLMINVVDLFLMCLLAIYLSSLEKYLFSPKVLCWLLYWIVWGDFLMNFRSSLYILNINPLPDIWFEKYFFCKHWSIKSMQF